MEKKLRTLSFLIWNYLIFDIFITFIKYDIISFVPISFDTIYVTAKSANGFVITISISLDLQSFNNRLKPFLGEPVLLEAISIYALTNNHCGTVDTILVR